MDATFNYNAQDRSVMAPGTIVVHGVTTAANPYTDTVKLTTPLATSGPNQYIYNDKADHEVAAESFATVAHTVQVFDTALGQPIHWAFNAPQLGVNYDWGTDFNAMYSRQKQGVLFYSNTDPKTQQEVWSGNSGELVSHETGHAILDSFRPAYIDNLTTEVAAFHEAWGDMMAIVMSFQDPRTRALVSDLSKPNVIAAIGEQEGTAINDYNNANVTGGNFCRNAENDLKYQDPATLGTSTDPDALSPEPHNFSRIWSGAFFDILNAIQKQNLAANSGNTQKALAATGAEALSLLCEMLRGAPQGTFTYKDMALAWIAEDKAHNNGKRAALIQQVMTDRQVLGSSVHAKAPFERVDADVEPHFTLTHDGMRPLSDVTHRLRITLGDDCPEPFRGATALTTVDNGRDDEAAAGILSQSVTQMIRQGRVLVTAPGQRLTDRDYLPYGAMLVYHNDGSKSIERVPFVT